MIIAGILLTLLAVLAGITYRMGGSGNWDRLWRMIGVTLCALAGMWVLHIWHWSLLLCAPVMGLALSTYWKVLNKWFGDTTEDAHWYNWVAHGVGVGLAFVPYGLATHTMWVVLGRAVVLGLVMAVWSELNEDVVWEENGRGQACEWSLLLLMIG